MACGDSLIIIFSIHFFLLVDLSNGIDLISIRGPGPQIGTLTAQHDIWHHELKRKHLFCIVALIDQPQVI